MLRFTMIHDCWAMLVGWVRAGCSSMRVCVVVAVMASQGFDVPLSKLADTPGAGAAFMDGWRVAYLLATAYVGMALALTLLTRPKEARVEAAIGTVAGDS